MAKAVFTGENNEQIKNKKCALSFIIKDDCLIKSHFRV